MNQNTPIGRDVQPGTPPALPLVSAVSLALPPLLLGVLAQRNCAHALQTIGRWSEDLFQGNRLPCQPFPDAANPAHQ